MNDEFQWISYWNGFIFNAVGAWYAKVYIEN